MYELLVWFLYRGTKLQVRSVSVLKFVFVQLLFLLLFFECFLGLKFEFLGRTVSVGRAAEMSYVAAVVIVVVAVVPDTVQPSPQENVIT